MKFLVRVAIIALVISIFFGIRSSQREETEPTIEIPALTFTLNR